MGNDGPKTTRPGGGHYAWNCIDKLEGKRLLTLTEKKALCEKINSFVHQPSPAVTVMTKIMPVIIIVLFPAGCMRAGTDTACGLLLMVLAAVCFVFYLLLYILKEVYVYDRWKTIRKEVMRKDVYQVPVMIRSTYRAEGKSRPCYATIKYTEEEDFLETYRITEYLYNRIGRVDVCCYYYEGRREKYQGKYKVFFMHTDTKLHKQNRNPEN